MSSDFAGNEELLNNDPIADPTDDAFGRGEFVNRLARIIRGRRDSGSFVVGLYGPWGTGKSSVLNLLEKRLRHYRHTATKDEVVVIRFNPWNFADEQQLVRSFFRTLADHLDEPSDIVKAKAARKLGQQLQRLGSIASTAIGSVDSLITVATAMVPGGTVIKSVADAIKDGKLEQIGELLAPSAKELDDVRAEINKALDEQKRPIVVIMDDIDRLDRHEIQAVFKLVKLTADLRHVTYVLAFDPEIVVSALEERYGDPAQSAGFLEKIIQAPVHLPAIDPTRLEDIVIAALNHALAIAGLENAISPDDASRFQTAFARGIQPLLTTPRAVKRFANAVIFALPLLAGEVNPIDLILLEALRLTLPDLYASVRDNRGVYLNEHGLEAILDKDRGKKERAKAFAADLDGLDGARRAAVVALLEQLFPTLEELSRNVSVGDNATEWQRARRIASPDYFHRYFQYGVGTSDVADQPFVALFNRLDSRDEEAIAGDFAEMMEVSSPELVVNKLHTLDYLISSTAASKVAVAFARVADRLPPRQRRATLSISPQEQGAILLVRLLEKLLEREERERTELAIVAACQSLPFKIVLRRWLRPASEKEHEATLVISDDVAAALHASIVGDIRDLAASGPLYEQDPRDAAGYFTLWARWGDRNEIRQHLERSFSSGMDGAERFLACFVTESPMGNRGMFAQQYEEIGKIVEHEWLAKQLSAVYELDGTSATAQYGQLHRAATTPPPDRPGKDL